MRFIDAVNSCPVRGAIYRKTREMRPRKRFWKNHIEPIEDRVPAEDQLAEDWEVYDPRDDDDCSLFGFND
jgi:hypothetical protein